MILNKKQLQNKSIYLGSLICLFISQIVLNSYQSLAQESYKLNEIEINRTTNLEDENNIDLPTNPFEIVDRIRRANSMNDATKPSDAIDEAIKSFDMIKEEEQI